MMTIFSLVTAYIYVLLHLEFGLVFVHYFDHCFVILNLASRRGHLYTYIPFQMLLHLVAY